MNAPVLAEATIAPSDHQSAVQMVMPLAGESSHVNYSDEDPRYDTYDWQDVNSGKWSRFAVASSQFIYAPKDGWFVYGLFGPIEAVKYDFNSKYKLWGGRHNGIDFATPIGTPVIAALAGKVIFAGNSAGQTLVVQNGNLQITYAHLNKFLVKVGEGVEQGRVIAKSGKSGALSPHLHFQIDELRGTELWAINPVKYLRPELEKAIVPNVPANRYINGNLPDWETPAEDFRW
ncbi:MAG: M23 family metallopeptidase [bacterium]